MITFIKSVTSFVCKLFCSKSFTSFTTTYISVNQSLFAVIIVNNRLGTVHPEIYLWLQASDNHKLLQQLLWTLKTHIHHRTSQQFPCYLRPPHPMLMWFIGVPSVQESHFVAEWSLNMNKFYFYTCILRLIVCDNKTFISCINFRKHFPSEDHNSMDF